MKKAPLLITLFILLFLLTACGSGSASTNGFRGSVGGSDPLNPESKLALGTIKLEGTQQAVDSKMAANLLPLWQLLIQLNASTSTAPQEVTAVVDQIQTTMTPDQIKMINSMPLTRADIFTVFQQQGQANDPGGTNTSGNTRSSNSSGRNGGNGGFFPGGGPGGPGGDFPGGGFGNNGGSSTQTNSAQTAAEAAQARQKAMTTLLINQVIKLLEAKLGS